MIYRYTIKGCIILLIYFYQYVWGYVVYTGHKLTTLFVHFQNATCFATDKGLKVTVEDSKCVQASAFIQREVFQVCWILHLLEVG